MEALYFGSESSSGEASCVSYPSRCPHQIHWTKLETVGCLALFEGHFNLRDVYRPHIHPQLETNDLHFINEDSLLESQLQAHFSQPVNANSTTLRNFALNFQWYLLFSSQIPLSVDSNPPRSTDCPRCDVIRTAYIDSGNQRNDIQEMSGSIALEGFSALMWPWKIDSSGNVSIESSNSDDFTHISVSITSDCLTASNGNCAQSWTISMTTNNLCNSNGWYKISLPISQAERDEYIVLDFTISHQMDCGQLDTSLSLSGNINLMSSDYFTPYLGSFFHLGADAYFSMEASSQNQIANISVIDLSLTLENYETMNIYGLWKSDFHHDVLLKHEPEYYLENKVRWSIHIDRNFFEPLITDDDGKMIVTVTIMVSFVDEFRLPFRRRLTMGYDFSKILYLLPFMCKGTYDDNGAYPGQYVSYDCPEGGAMFVYCDNDGWNIEKSRDEGCNQIGEEENDDEGGGELRPTSTASPVTETNNMTALLMLLVLLGVCTASLLFWYCFTYTSKADKKRRRIAKKNFELGIGEGEMVFATPGLAPPFPNGPGIVTQISNRQAEGDIALPAKMGHPMKQGEFVQQSNGGAQPPSINSMSIQVAPGMPPRIQRPFEKPAVEFQVMKKQGNFPQAHHPPGMVYVNGVPMRASKLKKKKKKKKRRRSLGKKMKRKRASPVVMDRMMSVYPWWTAMLPEIKSNILALISTSPFHLGRFPTDVKQTLQTQHGLTYHQIENLQSVSNIKQEHIWWFVLNTSQQASILQSVSQSMFHYGHVFGHDVQKELKRNFGLTDAQIKTLPQILEMSNQSSTSTGPPFQSIPSPNPVEQHQNVVYPQQAVNPIFNSPPNQVQQVQAVPPNQFQAAPANQFAKLTSTQDLMKQLSESSHTRTHLKEAARNRKLNSMGMMPTATTMRKKKKKKKKSKRHSVETNFQSVSHGQPAKPAMNNQNVVHVQQDLGHYPIHVRQQIAAQALVKMNSVQKKNKMTLWE